MEVAEIIAERISRCGWLALEQILITSSYCMNHLPRHIAFGKLQPMVGAKNLLG